MQNEKCKSCFECAETAIVKVRNDRNSEWRDSSVRRCANDQCWHIVEGTREDRLAWISNVYDYKYFGDYELSPEQLAAVYEAKILAASEAALSTGAEPVKPKRWLIEDIQPSGSICWHVTEHEHHARKHAATLKNAIVSPLYAAPPAPSVAVKEGQR